MKSSVDCLPCFFRQVIDTSRLITRDENIIKDIVNRVIKFLSNVNYDRTPPDISRDVYRIISEVTGCSDPYREIKRSSNEKVLKLYDGFKKAAESRKDPVAFAIKLAVAGNIMDYGSGVRFDLDRSISETLDSSFAIDDYNEFVKCLKGSRMLLYLGDNAGEIVFDRLFIEELIKAYGLEVYYAVRGGPIINDVTMEDARQVGMQSACSVIDNGFDAPGVIISRCSGQFREIYEKADILLSKGQGNYETLEDGAGKNIFFLLKIKCPFVAKHLNRREGEMVFLKK